MKLTKLVKVICNAFDALSLSTQRAWRALFQKRCSVCGRVLVNPKSIRAGMGSVCLEKHNAMSSYAELEAQGQLPLVFSKDGATPSDPH